MTLNTISVYKLYLSITTLCRIYTSQWVILDEPMNSDPSLSNWIGNTPSLLTNDALCPDPYLYCWLLPPSSSYTITLSTSGYLDVHLQYSMSSVLKDSEKCMIDYTDDTTVALIAYANRTTNASINITYTMTSASDIPSMNITLRSTSTSGQCYFNEFKVISTYKLSADTIIWKDKMDIDPSLTQWTQELNGGNFKVLNNDSICPDPYSYCWMLGGTGNQARFHRHVEPVPSVWYMTISGSVSGTNSIGCGVSYSYDNGFVDIMSYSGSNTTTFIHVFGGGYDNSPKDYMVWLEINIESDILGSVCYFNEFSLTGRTPLSYDPSTTSYPNTSLSPTFPMESTAMVTSTSMTTHEQLVNVSAFAIPSTSTIHSTNDASNVTEYLTTDNIMESATDKTDGKPVPMLVILFLAVGSGIFCAFFAWIWVRFCMRKIVSKRLTMHMDNAVADNDLHSVEVVDGNAIDNNIDVHHVQMEGENVLERTIEGAEGNPNETNNIEVVSDDKHTNDGETKSDRVFTDGDC